jgi:hypothetical protein
MRFISFCVGCAVVIAACGGTTGVPNDGGNDGTTGDSGGNNDGGNDGQPNDSGGGADVIAVDAAECTPPDTNCTQPCPQGTYCLVANGPTPHQLGCTTIPAACNGVASCACMADCFCPPTGVNKCMKLQNTLTCDNGTVSRREFKTDIDYVSSSERSELAREALSIPLARYRYKTEPKTESRHLGFIIDDQPAQSPAVASDATHVDLYGYTSMLVATVQEQQKQIDELKKQVDELRARRK